MRFFDSKIQLRSIIFFYFLFVILSFHPLRRFPELIVASSRSFKQASSKAHEAIQMQAKGMRATGLRIYLSKRSQTSRKLGP
jgi:hypothetical protein